MKSLSLPLFALAMLAPWLAAYNAYPAEPPVEAPATAPAVPPTTGPYSGQQLSLMVKAIEDLRQENAQLRGMLEAINFRLSQSPDYREGDVPDYDITKRIPGMWVQDPDTGMNIYAKSQWVIRRHGHGKVLECIRIGKQPVPVDAVIYGSHNSVPPPVSATPIPQQPAQAFPVPQPVQVPTINPPAPFPF